jgi:hypothetical protein
VSDDAERHATMAGDNSQFARFNKTSLGANG